MVSTDYTHIKPIDRQTLSYFCSLFKSHTHTYTPFKPSRLWLSFFNSISTSTHTRTPTHTEQKSAFWKSLMTNAEIDKMAPHYKAIIRTRADVFQSKRPFGFSMPLPVWIPQTYNRIPKKQKYQNYSRSIFAAIEMDFFLFSFCSFPPPFVVTTKSKGLENSAWEYTSLPSGRV